MLMKILPILLALIGLAGGGAAGYFLRPPPPPPEETAGAHGEDGAAADAGHAAPADTQAAADHGADGHGEDGAEEAPTTEFVKLNNQFVVPVIEEGQVTSLVVLSLSLEVTLGSTEKVYAAEPKIRDLLLQVLFDHANAGGFKGAFTNTATMADLRRTMLEAVRQVLGSAALSVLVSDIVRQDS